jgi:hypothetical protein
MECTGYETYLQAHDVECCTYTQAHVHSIARKAVGANGCREAQKEENDIHATGYTIPYFRM